MSYCPKCKAEVAADARVCDTCGEDFSKPIPSPEETIARDGFAYGLLADIALTVGQVAAVFGALVSAGGSVHSIVGGDWGSGLIYGPICTLLMLALFVTFRRVADLK